MIHKLSAMPEESSTLPCEGELYKIIRLFGVAFEIRYGFYEERDRSYRYAEPIPIFPDFIKSPCFTDDGMPFATAIQLPCSHFVGRENENNSCEDCAYYRPCEELLGICICPSKKRQYTKNQKGGANLDEC